MWYAGAHAPLHRPVVSHYLWEDHLELVRNGNECKVKAQKQIDKTPHGWRAHHTK